MLPHFATTFCTFKIHECLKTAKISGYMKIVGFTLAGGGEVLGMLLKGVQSPVPGKV